MPKLSILLPTFNSGATIRRCLQSIKRQAFRDFEVLIQDGMSTDDTAKVIEAFTSEHPDIILKLQRCTDKGVYDAMNKLLQRATGEWIYFLGSDDELYGELSLAQMLESPEAVKTDVLYGNVRMVPVDGNVENAVIYDGPFTLRKLLRRNICHQAIFYRRKLIDTIGNYNIGYRKFADWDYNMRCLSQTRLQYIDVIVATFYLGGISDSSLPDVSFANDVASNVIRYFDLSIFNPLVNSPLFIGVQGIEKMQRERSAGHHAVGKSLQYMNGILERAERKATRAFRFWTRRNSIQTSLDGGAEGIRS